MWVWVGVGECGYMCGVSVCVWVQACTHRQVLWHMWRSEDDLEESVFSFCHVGLRMELRWLVLVASTFTH